MKICPKCNEKIKGKVAFCPSCGEKIGRRGADEKRARLTEEKKSGKPLALIIGALVVVGAVALGAVALFRPAPTSVNASSDAATHLTFNTADFADGVAKYYNYKAPDGKNLKFFVLKSSDGIIRAAFDACDVCYAAKKGYRQEGNFMVCNNCGQKFISTKINEVKGGCNPAPLDRTLEGDTLKIAVADILPGGRFF